MFFGQLRSTLQLQHTVAESEFLYAELMECYIAFCATPPGEHAPSFLTHNTLMKSFRLHLAGLFAVDVEGRTAIREKPRSRSSALRRGIRIDWAVLHSRIDAGVPEVGVAQAAPQAVGAAPEAADDVPLAVGAVPLAGEANLAVHVARLPADASPIPPDAPGLSLSNHDE